MSHESSIICPQCNERVSAGTTCEQCGFSLEVDELPIQDTPSAEPTPAPWKPTGDLQLEWNEATPFQEGMVSAFQFRVTFPGKKTGELKNFEIRLEPGIQGHIRPVLPRELHGDGPWQWASNFKPAEYGVGISGALEVRFELEGEKFTYLAEFVWTCAPSRHNPVGQHFAIQGDLRVSEAGELNIHGQSPVMSLMEHHQNAIAGTNLAPKWRKLELTRFHTTTISHTSSLESSSPNTKGLTLVNPSGKRVHLLAKLPAVLGRNKETADIVLRAYLPGGELDQLCMQRISRIHCTIHYQQGFFQIQDRSTRGTFVNRTRLSPSGQPFRLDAGILYNLTLAGPDLNAPQTMQFALLLLPGPEPSTGGVFLRKHCPVQPEEYILIQGKADVSTPLRSEPPTLISHQNGRFVCYHQSTITGLQPGSKLNLQGTTWEIHPLDITD